MAALPCVQCGYDLSGLSAKGVCPECAAPVSRTLGAALRGASRGYRRRVRAGALVLLGSVQLLLLPFLVGVPLRVLGDLGSERLFVLSAAGAAAWFPGCWLLSGAAPGSLEVRIGRIRGVARVSSAYICAVVVFGFPAVLFERATVLLAIAGLFGVAAALLAWVSSFDIVADIAGATGDSALKRRAERSGWWPIGLLLGVPLAVLVSFGADGAGVPGHLGLLVIAIVVLGAMWVDTSVVLVRFWERLGTSRAP